MTSFHEIRLHMSLNNPQVLGFTGSVQYGIDLNDQRVRLASTPHLVLQFVA